MSLQANSKVEIPRIVSVDDHVMEPPRLWQEQLPAKFRDIAPRVERGKIGRITRRSGSDWAVEFDDQGDWGDYWLYEDKPIPMKRINASVGMPLDLRENVPITYEDMRPGCYDVKARLEDMDLNHVEASLCFPTFPRFCGQTFSEGKDRDLGLACVQVYNDWMVDGWAGPSDGRLIPLCLVPLWSPELAAAEVLRNAERGVHAVAFSEIPAFLGYASIHSGAWEPFLHACEDTETTICMHVGSASVMPKTSDDAPVAVGMSISFNVAMASLSDWLFSGILERHPRLRLAYSEAQIGWLPYALERMDTVWDQHRAWAGVKDTVPNPPSSYYYRQVFGCFFRDRHGLKSIDEVGVDNATFETDYPHTDSTWPDTKEIAEEHFAHLPSDVIYKIVRGNAIRMLSLDLDRK